MNSIPSIDPRWQHPKYILKRKLLRMFGASFYIYEGTDTQLCFFVDQKGFKLREDIRVYSDESKTHEVFLIKARQIMDFNAAYDVVDSATGTKIGMLRRHGWRGIARDEWDICRPDDSPFAKLIEDSLAYALIRRLLTALLPQKYDLLIGDRLMVDFTQNFNPFTYHLNIDFTHDPQWQVDRRLALAGAILMAAIEGRQG